MHIELRDQCFDPWAEVTAFRDRMLLAGQYGACAVFVGTMRDYNDGDRVCSMYLEHYPGMTEKQFESLVSASQSIFRRLSRDHGGAEIHGPLLEERNPRRSER